MQSEDARSFAASLVQSEQDELPLSLMRSEDAMLIECHLIRALAYMPFHFCGVKHIFFAISLMQSEYDSFCTVHFCGANFWCCLTHAE